MGTIQDGLRKGAIEGAMSYSGRFRYHLEFGKGMVVSRLGIRIAEFDGTSGGTRPLNLYSAKDNSLVIALEQARRSKRLALYAILHLGLSSDPQTVEDFDVISELGQIYNLATPFFLSFAVQKNTNGKMIEMLVLQDNAATFSKPPSTTERPRLRLDFILKAPEVKPVSLAR